jgi:hypothetical protein
MLRACRSYQLSSFSTTQEAREARSLAGFIQWKECNVSILLIIKPHSGRRMVLLYFLSLGARARARIYKYTLYTNMRTTFRQRNVSNFRQSRPRPVYLNLERHIYVLHTYTSIPVENSLVFSFMYVHSFIFFRQCTIVAWCWRWPTRISVWRVV